jgi:hypothetical protein
MDQQRSGVHGVPSHQEVKFGGLFSREIVRLERAWASYSAEERTQELEQAWNLCCRKIENGEIRLPGDDSQASSVSEGGPRRFMYDGVSRPSNTQKRKSPSHSLELAWGELAKLRLAGWHEGYLAHILLFNHSSPMWGSIVDAWQYCIEMISSASLPYGQTPPLWLQFRQEAMLVSEAANFPRYRKYADRKVSFFRIMGLGSTNIAQLR